MGWLVEQPFFVPIHETVPYFDFGAGAPPAPDLAPLPAEGLHEPLHPNWPTQDHFFSLSVGTLVPAWSRIFGLYGGLDVENFADNGDGTFTVEGVGYLNGQSAGPTLEARWEILQHTDLGQGLRVPAALFSVNLRQRSFAMDGYNYKFTADAGALEDFVRTTGTEYADYWEQQSHDTPTVDGTPTSEDVTATEDFVNDFVSGTLDLNTSAFNIGDIFSLSRAKSTAQLYMTDLTVDASIGTWDHADGGDLFHQRVGLFDEIRLHARLGGALAYGDRIQGVLPYFVGELGVESQYLTVYWWDHKYPGQIQIGGGIGIGMYNNLNDNIIDDYTFAYADPLRLSVRW